MVRAIILQAVLKVALVRQPEAVEWDEAAEEALALARQAKRDEGLSSPTAH